MPWLNADSKMYLHEKCRQAGLSAMGLWLMGGTYAADNLTDGHVPSWYVTSWPSGKRHARSLVDARLWDVTDDGYLVRSWSEYQRTKDEVLEAVAADAERRSRGGQRAAHNKWHVERGVISQNCSLCPGDEPPMADPVA